MGERKNKLLDYQGRIPFEYEEGGYRVHPARPAASFAELSYGNPDIKELIYEKDPTEAFIKRGYDPLDVKEFLQDRHRISSMSSGQQKVSTPRGFLQVIPQDLYDSIVEEHKLLKKEEKQKRDAGGSGRTIEILKKMANAPRNFFDPTDVGKVGLGLAQGMTQDLVGRLAAVKGYLTTLPKFRDTKLPPETIKAMTEGYHGVTDKPWVTIPPVNSTVGRGLEAALQGVGKAIEWGEEKVGEGIGHVTGDKRIGKNVQELLSTALALSSAKYLGKRLFGGAKAIKGTLATLPSKGEGVAQATNLNDFLKALEEPPKVKVKIPPKMPPPETLTVPSEARAAPLGDFLEELRSQPKTEVAPTAEAPIVPPASESIAALEELKEPLPVPTTAIRKGAIKEFFDPFANLPDKDAYLLSRGSAQGTIAKGSELAKEFLKPVQKLPEESRNRIFRAIDTPEEFAEREPMLSGVEDTIKQSIVEANDKLGQQFVDRGYLDQGHFDELKGKYLRRENLKHILGEENVTPGQIKADISTFKARDLKLTPEQRNAMGLIEDVAKSEESYLKNAVRNLGVDEHLQTIAKNPEWVWKDSIVEVKSPLIPGQAEKIPLGELRREVEQQRMVVRAAPTNTLAQARLTALEETLTKAPVPPPDFVKTPDSSAWGPLKNLYVRKPIFDDIHSFLPEVVAETGVGGGGVQKIRRIFETGTGWFKVSKTALNVPSWFRNLTDGITRMDLSGISTPKIPYYYIKAAKSMVVKDANFRRAQASGIFEGSFGSQELRAAAQAVEGMFQVKDEGWLGQVSGGLRRVGQMTRPAIDAMSAGYQAPDNIARYAMYLSKLGERASPADAVLFATKWGMDYSVANPIVKQARKFWAPFATYDYKFMPLLVETAKERPWKLIKYSMLPYVVNELISKASGTFSPKEVESIVSIYPERMDQYGSVFLLPTRSPTNAIRFVPIESYLPWNKLLQVSRGAQQGDLRAASQLLSFGNPLLDLYAMIETSRGGPLHDAFTGQPIYEPLDTAYMKTLKFTGKMLENVLVPSFLTSGGALGKAWSVINAENLAHQRRDLKWADVVISMLGGSTHPLDPEKQERLRSMAERTLRETWKSAERYGDSNKLKENEEEYYRLLALLQPQYRKPKGVSNEEFMQYTRGVVGQQSGIGNPKGPMDLEFLEEIYGKNK